ncbi:MAG: WD40 repeat domain-containing protein [Gemmataceae bacterium]
MAHGWKSLFVALALVWPAVATEPRLDAFGDPLPPGAVRRIGTARLRHAASISALAFSPDGKIIAAGSGDGMVRLWNEATGKLVREWTATRRQIAALAWSPDGRRLYGLCSNLDDQPGSMVEWDAGNGKALRDLPDELRERPSPFADAMAIAADGQTWLHATTENEAVRVSGWPAAELRFSLAIRTRVAAMGFTANGESLVTLEEDGFVRVTDTVTRNNRRAFFLFGRYLKLLWGNMAALAVAADGKTLAVSLPDESLRLIETTRGHELRRFAGTHAQASALALSPDGKTLAAACDHAIRFWDIDSGKERFPTGDAQLPLTASALSPDGRWLAAVDRGGALSVWNVADGRRVRHWPDAHGEPALAFTPDGKLLIFIRQTPFVTPARVSSEFHANLLDVEALLNSQANPVPRKVPVFLDRISPLACSPDGRTVAVLDSNSGRQILLHELPSGDLWVSFECPNLCRVGGALYAPDGKTLAVVASASTADNSGVRVQQSVYLFDSAGKFLQEVGPALRGTAQTLAFSPDGRTLAGWHLPEAAREPEPHSHDLVPPGPSRYETVRLWRWPNLHEIRQVELDEPSTNVSRMMPMVIGRDRAVPLTFSPDGRTLAFQMFGQIMLVETATGRPRRRLSGHLDVVSGLHFAPDGRRLVSISADGSALVWDITREPAERPLPELWELLAHGDPQRADPALWTMLATPERALPFLRERLQPARFDPTRIAARIADLDHKQFAKREAAAKDLREIGEPALPAIWQALQKSPSAEARRRLEQLVKGFRVPVPTGAELQAVRAVEVLGKIGTPEAVQLLERLASGAPEMALTQEARAALHVLKRPTPE